MKKKKKKDKEEKKEKKKIEEEKDEKKKIKKNNHDKSVPAVVSRKEKMIYPFSKIPTSNSFIVFENLHQIEWGEIVLMMDNAQFPESSNVSSSPSSPSS